MSTAVRIVLDPLYAAGDSILVALEVDLAITLFMSTTAMTGGDPAGVITPARF